MKKQLQLVNQTLTNHPTSDSCICTGDRYTAPAEVRIARYRVPSGSYHAGNDQKLSIAEQIRLARREVPQGEYHRAA